MLFSPTVDPPGRSCFSYLMSSPPHLRLTDGVLPGSKQQLPASALKIIVELVELTHPPLPQGATALAALLWTRRAGGAQRGEGAGKAAAPVTRGLPAPGRHSAIRFHKYM